MYRAYGLLKPDADFALQEAYKRLAARFPGYSVSRADDQVMIASGDWSIQVALVSGPHIPSETQGITDKIAGWEEADAEAVTASDERVEVWSDIPDPFMEHFNDYLQVIEVLKSFRGVIPVDPHRPSLL